MGHVQPKLTVCFITADGEIHKTKEAAKIHTNRIAHKLAQAKSALKREVASQKELKKQVKRLVEGYRLLLKNGYGTSQYYVADAQAQVDRTSDLIRYLEQNVAFYKRLLKGK